MKRLSVLAFALTIALSTFAYYGDHSYSSSSFEMPGWLIFMGIVMIVGGILNVILFFKIWGMTNNVAMLKKKLLDHSHGEETLSHLRKLLLTGRKEEVKEIMISHFCDEVENVYDLNKPIAPYVKNLEKDLRSIGEPVPEIIKKLNTVEDYYNLVKTEG